MASPISINLFLVDGDPHGLRVASLSNWTGQTVVCPRTRLADFASRDEAHRSGVYILLGEDSESNRPAMYIGEGDKVWSRIRAHDRDKDFWHTVYTFTSRDEKLTKSHIRFLESRLIQAAERNRHSIVQNGTAPPVPQLPESDIADMEQFLSNILLLLPILGCNLFTKSPVIMKEVPSAPSHDLIVSKDSATSFTLIHGRVSADAVVLPNGEFVVLAGSKARKDVSPSMHKGHFAKREELLQSGRLVDSEDPKFLEFTEDVQFNSPTAAVAIIRTQSLNGRKEWRLAENTETTYHMWTEQFLKEDEKDDL